jgi:hypothetical protein
MFRDEKAIIEEEEKDRLVARVPKTDLEEHKYRQLVLAEIRQVKDKVDRNYNVNYKNLQQKYQALLNWLERMESKIESLHNELKEQSRSRRGFFS